MKRVLLYLHGRGGCAEEAEHHRPLAGHHEVVGMAQAGGEPMKSCFEDAALVRLLEKHGFLLYEALSPDEIDRRYFSGRKDALSAFEHIHLVHAVCKKTGAIRESE